MPGYVKALCFNTGHFNFGSLKIGAKGPDEKKEKRLFKKIFFYVKL